MVGGFPTTMFLTVEYHKIDQYVNTKHLIASNEIIEDNMRAIYIS